MKKINTLLSKFSDLLTLNVLFILLSIPIISCTSAWISMNTVLRQTQEENLTTLEIAKRMFILTFKNMKKGLVCFVAIAIISFLCFINVIFLLSVNSAINTPVLMVLALFFLVILSFFYGYASDFLDLKSDLPVLEGIKKYIRYMIENIGLVAKFVVFEFILIFGMLQLPFVLIALIYPFFIPSLKALILNEIVFKEKKEQFSDEKTQIKKV